ncbi:MAG TPA: 3-oxoacyl-ACP reductase FabG [Dehalococcoidia bacterium]|nr:3-oxoacyl-ACP reductase FabG [Dehalococcoidia bacterium]
MSLEGKVALVTGGGRGIGRAIALRLARDGADVAVNDVNPETASRTAAEVAALGRRSLAVPADVADGAQITDMVHKVMAHFGKIDILVNNAGIGHMRPFLEISDQEWEQMLRINAYGVFKCAQVVAREMVKQRSGRIINMASVAGRQGQHNMCHYSAAKGAVIAMTHTMAKELAPYGILVNALAPGVIDTEIWVHQDEELRAIRSAQTGKTYEKGSAFQHSVKMALLGRPGTAEEVANVAAFLASSDSDFVTGQTINVDGGIYFD